MLPGNFGEQYRQRYTWVLSMGAAWQLIIAFLVRLGGASVMSTTDVEAKTVLLGLHVYMGGIGTRELFILYCWGLAIQIHRVMLRMEEK